MNQTPLNPVDEERLKKALEQSANGQVVSRGSFAQYAQPPLNPDALGRMFATAMMEVLDAEKLQPGNRLAHVNDIQEVLNRLEKNILTVAQPVLNSVEELDQLPVGSVVLDVYGASVTKLDHSTWVRVTPAIHGGRMFHAPYLPARVLYRPAVES